MKNINKTINQKHLSFYDVIRVARDRDVIRVARDVENFLVFFGGAHSVFYNTKIFLNPSLL